MKRGVRLDPNPPGLQVAVMVTRRCNMACGHCSVESGPGVRGEPAEAELLDWVRQLIAGGVRSVRLTGGEPMLRASTVLQLVRECRRLGVGTSLVTNGFWGWSLPRARRQLRALQRAGLGSVTVSYDRYHADFQGPDPTIHISRAAEELGVPLNINLVRSTDEADLAQIVSQLEPSRGTRIRVYDLQPVGRARELAAESHRAEVEGFCTACAFPALADDGRLMACNGPAYFESPSSPLVLGSVHDKPLAELLDRHRQDPVLDTIRTSGPAGLRDELRRIPGFEAFPFRARYQGICDLCHHVTRSPEAVAALRERLGRPEAVARRVAAWQVIDGNRQHGALSVLVVNGIGACRVFLRAAWEPENGPGPDAERILGRADVDWRRLADYLTGCGLARPLRAALDDPDLTRWTPQFFRDELRTRGVADALLESVQREAIRQIADGLTEIGARGVLLKGTALMLRGTPDDTHRATGDVDLLVDAAVGRRLRAHLLARGFTGAADAGPDTFQHLEPLLFQGVGVEIHTRIMPAFWGLPERDMRAAARALPDTDVLATLSPEGLILHAGVHSSAHFFALGLRTAWDLLSVLRGGADVDWDRVAAWATACSMPRGFWAPVRVLSEELGLPLPAAFLRRAPLDAGARRIEAIARHRLFAATDAIFDLPKAGLLVLLQEGWPGRLRVLRHLGAKAQWRSGRPRTWNRTDWARRTGLLRRTWRQYRQYRRVVARVEPVPREEMG